ncbi:MAG: D-sedoheptulose 7-phosphate isomerase [Spirochaetes bacterium]|nr:D-sedoheptulose 7-phosphate isomerase [Spirochaetota bacterium]
MDKHLKQIIHDQIQDTIALVQKVKETLVDNILQVTDTILTSLKNGGKILICGNGGSAADAQHFAAELVGRFKKEREPIPAVSLTVDTSILTAWSNDYSFDTVFSRQVESLGNKGDILFGISTSGNSKNVMEAIKTANQKNLVTIGLLGKNGGGIKALCQHHLIVPGQDTPRIQEAHGLIIHILCHLIEESLF